ncbi:hypothetical protein [Nitrosomonas sp.]|uniref:hypothetical protein n=1 Tax=Nitrosomonas sp. TaxID=42353 RepID=UPI0025DE9EEB|nr:hypothetical protein [Nitrosomonas sp.]
MTKVNDLAAKIEQVNAQLHKAKDEIINEVTVLKDSLQNVEVPAAAEDALNNLAAIAQALDDLNPDQVEEPTDPQPVEEEPAGEEDQSTEEDPAPGEGQSADPDQPQE